MISKRAPYFIYLFLLVFIVACSSDDSSEPDTNGGSDPDPAIDPNNGECESGKTAVFTEKDGLLIIESENADFKSTPWTLGRSLTDFSGNGYLVWNGNDSFNQPGNGILTYKARISEPGTYRFIWKSYITIGTNGTEHNDSWLRIADAKHFYGRKGNGDIVYPNGTTQEPIPASEGQANTRPMGSSSDGWFKIYMNTASAWHWQSTTSDNDGHNIFVVFDEPGDYTIEISGRSNGHAIDRFALYKDGISPNQATNSDTTKSDISCE